jgi:hypothetical protein
MTSADHGALLGRYDGRWQLVALTAVFPLFVLLTGGMQMLAAGRLEGSWASSAP